MADALQIYPLRGLPEIRPGEDLAELIVTASIEKGPELATGDIVVVAQKAVSKAEGRLVALSSITPSPFAIDYAQTFDKDARHVEVVLRESRRIVRMDHGVLVVETRDGLVCANAGVDASNVDGEDVLCLLPENSDASASRLMAAINRRLGKRVAVIITDTFGRPWREGQTNVAIGVAGMEPLRDYAGQIDQYGYELRVTLLCVADEIASAAELVMGKIDRVPVAILRGYAYDAAAGSARMIVRAAEKDLFR
jgi:coenzyme F420-0:L-glutamate ligase / coenzyme F420-1:gamma-L-glutamate ligase